MPKVGEIVAKGRRTRHTPIIMTPTKWIASGSCSRITQRSRRRPTKEMFATYAVDHMTMPGAPR